MADSLTHRVRSLSIVLQDADIVLSNYEADERQRTNAQEISRGCHKVLIDLEKQLLSTLSWRHGMQASARR